MPCLATTKPTEKRQQATALPKKAAAEAAASCNRSEYDLELLYHRLEQGQANVPAGATCYHLARMRYFSTEVPSLATGTMNWAAKAAVFVYLWLEETISQSPPMGSFTLAGTDAAFWWR